MLLSHGLAHRPRKIWLGNLRNAVSQAHGCTWQRAQTHESSIVTIVISLWEDSVLGQVPHLKLKKSMRLWANSVDLYGPCHAPTQRIETSLVEQEEVIFQTGWILTEFPKGQEGTMLCFPANKVEWARMKKHSRVSLSTQIKETCRWR